MPLKMTNEVSIMDVVAIGGSLLVGAGVFFGYGVDIGENTVAIQHIKGDLVKIEKQNDDGEKKILDLLNKQGDAITDIRKEAATGRLRIEDKLDKLIDRELDKRGGP